MKRFLAMTLAASAIALALAACDERGDDWTYGRHGDPCLQFTTCGSCTPVYGCGWCSTPRGSACVSDPDECAGAPQFSWTWEPSGCTVVADAGITGDAGVAPDAAIPDSSPPEPVDAGLVDHAEPADVAAPEDVSAPDATPASDATPE